MNDAKETPPLPLDFLKVSGLMSRPKKAGPDKKYATFNRRMLAATFDSLILMIVTTPIINSYIPITNFTAQTYALDSSDPLAVQRQMIRVLTDSAFIHSWLLNLAAQMLVLAVFSGVCWHFWSATPGKMLCRIKVADATTEQPLTDKQILLRIWGYFVSSICLFIGFFWISFDKRRQGWHDKIAHTVVLVLPWKMPSLK